jgi:glycosyltransferase involved in cell wall biosynthesis
MYRNKSITVCLPCRNEASHLSEVIKRIPKFVDEVIVVSNKSTDNTIKVAEDMGIRVFEDNRTIGGIGYGFAHMTAIDNATGDIIVGADGDTTYPLENLRHIIDHMLDNEFDLLSCNRYPIQAKGAKIPLKLRLGVWLLNTEVRLFYGLKINDVLSGMWLFRKSINKNLGLTMGDWNFSPQIKLNAALHTSIKFGEYNIAQYARKGHTHQNYFRTGLSHAIWILKNRFSSIPSPAKDTES